MRSPEFAAGAAQSTGEEQTSQVKSKSGSQVSYPSSPSSGTGSAANSHANTSGTTVEAENMTSKRVKMTQREAKAAERARQAADAKAQGNAQFKLEAYVILCNFLLLYDCFICRVSLRM